ncbi:MAG: PAS domain-containing sensor histidine kinase, partial [Aggregatilineales bacterium]
FLHHFELLADAFLEVMILTDGEGCILYSNAVTGRVTGYSPDLLRNQMIDMLIDDASRKNLQLFYREFIGRKDVPRIKLQLESQALHRGGNAFPVEINLNPLEVAGQSLVIITMTDLSGHKETAQKLLEAELMRQKLEHEQEMGNLNQEWVAMVSHEFRNPLAVIKSSIDLMLRHEARMNPVVRHKQLERIQSQAARMNNLMEDLLVISKLDARQFVLEPEMLDLAELTQTLCEDTEIMQNHDVQVIFHGVDTPIMTDRSVLQHILINLMSNARKYTPEQGEILLTVQQSSQAVEITIKDSGIGIPEDDLNNLFQPFFRASNTGKIKGTGMGLAIVRKHVDLLDGQIEVESMPGLGTIFTVNFPIEQPALL